MSGVATAHYLAHEAGRLAGVDGDRIGQWSRWGHIRASVSAGDPHVYAFADVADALAIRLLLDAGVTLPAIRHAVERLDGDHPLSHGLHVVDGRMAVERAGGLEDVFTEQRVLELDGKLDPVMLLRAGGWPSLVTGVTGVEVDPARAGGRPCLSGRRVPVEDAVAAPDGLDLTPEQLADAHRWWDACAS
jgi:DNA-binding transcriptional MerR regulator